MFFVEPPYFEAKSMNICQCEYILLNKMANLNFPVSNKLIIDQINAWLLQLTKTEGLKAD